MSSFLRATRLWRVLAQALGSASMALACQAHAQPLTFERALDAAQQHSALLQARRAAADGARAAQASAAQLPDPRLTVGVDNLPVTTSDRFSLTRDSMTQLAIGWTQEVPNAAKRAARRDMAAARTERERALLQSDESVVQREASMAWLASYYAQQRLAAFSALEAENQLLRDTVYARIAAARAAPADAVLARQDALALADRRDELQRDAARAGAALRRWVGPAADAPLAGEPPASAAASLSAGALQHHPELASYAPQADMARAELREMEAAKTGDWSWGVSFGKRGPAYSDMVSLQLSMELPLWAAQRQDPQIAARRFELQRIDAEREDMRRRVVGEIEALQADDAQLTSQLDRLTRQSLPLDAERAALQLASYQAGRADLGSVLASRRDAIETRLRRIELQGRQAQVRAQLAAHLAKEQP